MSKEISKKPALFLSLFLVFGIILGGTSASPNILLAQTPSETTHVWSFAEPEEWEIVEGSEGVEWLDGHIRLKEQNSPQVIDKFDPPVPRKSMLFVNNDQSVYLVANYVSENDEWHPYFAEIDLRTHRVNFEHFLTEYPENLGYSPYYRITLQAHGGAQRFVLDSQRNVYVPVDGWKVLDGSDNRDMGVCKFTYTGELKWCSFMNTFDYKSNATADLEDRAYDVGIDESRGAVYMFGRGPNLADWVIARYDMETGEREWVFWYDHAGEDQCWGGTLDLEGNPIAAGYMEEDHKDHHTVMKLSPSGQMQWVKLYHYLDSPYYNRLRKVNVDREGNIIATGTYLVIKYRPDGTLLWVKKWDPSQTPMEATWMELDRHNNIYVFYAGYITKLDPNGNEIWTLDKDEIGTPPPHHKRGTIGGSGLILTYADDKFVLISEGYKERAVLVSKNPVYYSDLKSLTVEAPYTLGKIYLQLSVDKQTWYRYNGSEWVIAEGYEGNTPEEVSAH
ncbi:hypothetical protein J7L13_02945, partial [bacterium]|nr:hypothetical protein [bacterium]